MAALEGEYYARAHAVFRRASNQAELMLKETARQCRAESSLSILSAGAGSGLFEIPMLEMLIQQGVRIRRFTGVEIDVYAASQLRSGLKNRFGTQFPFEVVTAPFESYPAGETYDLFLFNHVFEYFPKGHSDLLEKARSLLNPGGRILLFSPMRGGINTIYAQRYAEFHGYTPVFADVLARLLEALGAPYTTKILQAECDIHLLADEEAHEEKLMLLSFLTQIDCRALRRQTQQEYIDFFLSLRENETIVIPHPTTLFVIR